MSDDERKNYFHIGKMTEEFRKLTKDDLMDPIVCRVWELRFQLAIAQQLSVVSGRLTEVTQLLIEQTKR